MRFTGHIRPMDDLGRLIVPKKVREELKVEAGTYFEIYVDGENIVFKPHNPSNTNVKKEELTNHKFRNF